jgi:hypothetical protein
MQEHHGQQGSCNGINKMSPWGSLKVFEPETELVQSPSKQELLSYLTHSSTQTSRFTFRGFQGRRDLVEHLIQTLTCCTHHTHSFAEQYIP